MRVARFFYDNLPISLHELLRILCEYEGCKTLKVPHTGSSAGTVRIFPELEGCKSLALSSTAVSAGAA
eukprot:jgi/Botrbrau1/22644/Bobra.176_1s0066.1